MNASSPSPRGCAGCSRDLGYAMNALAITHRGRRYEVCGRSCLDRLMEHLAQSSTTSTTSTGATNATTITATTITAHDRRLS